MRQDNGGPAFPLQSIGPEFPPGYAGMTLRDYFAAKALPAIYTEAVRDAANTGLFSCPGWRYGVANDAYQMADAMLKARQS